MSTNSEFFFHFKKLIIFLAGKPLLLPLEEGSWTTGPKTWTTLWDRSLRNPCIKYDTNCNKGLNSVQFFPTSLKAHLLIWNAVTHVFQIPRDVVYIGEAKKNASKVFFADGGHAFWEGEELYLKHLRLQVVHEPGGQRGGQQKGVRRHPRSQTKLLKVELWRDSYRNPKVGRVCELTCKNLQTLTQLFPFCQKNEPAALSLFWHPRAVKGSRIYLSIYLNRKVNWAPFCIFKRRHKKQQNISISQQLLG